jgi:hypothetical protein
VSIKHLRGTLLSALIITSVMALAIPLLSSSPAHAALISPAPVGGITFPADKLSLLAASGTKDDGVTFNDRSVATAATGGKWWECHFDPIRVTPETTYFVCYYHSAEITDYTVGTSYETPTYWWFSTSYDAGYWHGPFIWEGPMIRFYSKGAYVEGINDMLTPEPGWSQIEDVELAYMWTPDKEFDLDGIQFYSSDPGDAYIRLRGMTPGGSPGEILREGRVEAEPVFTVSPGAFTVQNVPLTGEPLTVPQRIVVWNGDNVPRTVSITTEIPSENDTSPGYGPIPNENWVIPFPSSILIPENSFAEIQIMLNIPRWENLTWENWEVWIPVERQPILIDNVPEPVVLRPTVRMKIETTEELPAPVGGVAFSPDKLALLAPYIILAALIAIASMSVAVYWRRHGGKK